MKQRLMVCIVFIITLFCVPAYAVGDPTLTIGTVSAVAGNEVSVPITIQNNPGVAMADLKVEYDNSALTLVSVENGTVFSKSDLTESYSSSSPYPILFVSTTGNRLGNGTLITLHFKVNESCSNGTYPLAFRSGSILSDFNENVLTTHFISGGVTVDGTQIVSVSKSSGGTSAIVVCTRTNATVICAAYNANGKMTGMESRPASTGQKTYNFSFATGNNVKIFVLDAAYRPLCESKSK